MLLTPWRRLTMLDTADMYAVGRNEELVGRALTGGWRELALVATKFGHVRDAETGAARVEAAALRVAAAETSVQSDALVTHWQNIIRDMPAK